MMIIVNWHLNPFDQKYPHFWCEMNTQQQQQEIDSKCIVVADNESNGTNCIVSINALWLFMHAFYMSILLTYKLVKPFNWCVCVCAILATNRLNSNFCFITNSNVCVCALLHPFILHLFSFIQLQQSLLRQSNPQCFNSPPTPFSHLVHCVLCLLCAMHDLVICLFYSFHLLVCFYRKSRFFPFSFFFFLYSLIHSMMYGLFVVFGLVHLSNGS